MNLLARNRRNISFTLPEKDGYAVLLSNVPKGYHSVGKDLEYIIQQRGNYGWWNILNTPCYLFRYSAENPIPDINEQFAWLFACAYITQ